jgi:gliding motility-associated-like protein
MQATLGQQAGFTAPDSVCVGAPVQVKNLTTGAGSYSWNFCVSNIDTTPSAVNLGGFGGVLDAPVFMSVVQDGGNYYAFVTNNLSGHLICLKFGASLLNPAPAVQDLGNCGVIPITTEGIQVLNVGGLWTAIIVGGDGVSDVPRIVKVDLGASLAAMTPVGTNWNNIGDLNYPVKLYIFQDVGGLYHGYTVNFNTNTLTRFDFGASFVSPPTGVNLGNPNGVLNGPTGLFPIVDGGNYYLFLPNETGNTLTRLDFGNSLLNPPIATSLGNPGGVLNGPRDFAMVKFCGRTVGYGVNHFSNDLVKLDFPAGVADNNPTAASLGVLAGMDFPHSLSNFFQVGSNVYSFIPNASGNTITELIFEGCNNQNIPNSSLPAPPAYSYSVPGIYNISLMTDVGLPTQSSYCQSIVVLPPPTITLPADTSFCQGTSVKLTAGYYPGGIYAWNTGSDSNSAFINTSGQYRVDLNDYGCTASATGQGTALPVPVIDLPADTLFCDSGELRYATSQPVTFVWNTQSITDSTRADTSGSYWLQLNEAGCTAIDTVKVTIVSTHEVQLGDDTAYCGPGILQFPDTGQVTYQWSTGSDSSSTPVTVTGPYSLALSDRGCVSKDTVQITVIGLPDIYLPADTLFCDSGVLRYDSPLSVTYAWSTGSDSSSTVVKAGGKVKLSVDNMGCTVTDSSIVTIGQTPPIYLPGDTLLCGPGLLKYVSALPVTYTWSTGSVTDTTGVPVSGLYWLQLDNRGCLSRDSTQVTVNPVPVVNLGNDTTVCLSRQPYLLNAGNAPGYTFQWQDNSTGSTYSVITPGLYYVKATAGGCSAADSVSVWASPLPYFTLGKNQPICPGEAIYLNPGVDTLTYTWQNGSADTVLRVTEPGTYFVTGVNDCGSYQASVTIYKGICVVHVPSAFTPNGDGINDLFKVLGVEVVDHFDFCIFNRWGQKIFETEDKARGWDGACQGVLQPTGAYVYTLHFRYLITGQSYQMDGTVTLIR